MPTLLDLFSLIKFVSSICFWFSCCPFHLKENALPKFVNSIDFILIALSNVFLIVIACDAKFFFNLNNINYFRKRRTLD